MCVWYASGRRWLPWGVPCGYVSCVYNGMYVCMCVCIYIYIYIHTHTYIYVCIYTCISVLDICAFCVCDLLVYPLHYDIVLCLLWYSCICVCVCVYICIYIYIYTYTHTHLHNARVIPLLHMWMRRCRTQIWPVFLTTFMLFVCMICWCIPCIMT